MSVFCQVVAYLLVALPAVAQSQTFATVTIKPVLSADPRIPQLQVLPSGDMIAAAVPLIKLLSYAYDVPVSPSPRLATPPDWTVREKYDIEARTPADATPPLPPNAAPAGNPCAGLPTIFTVLNKLGPELKRQEDSLPAYTAERIERPAAN